METTATDVLLRVPARTPYARVVRVGAAALALREGLGFGEIDDLRLAIDEAMIALLDGLGDETEAELEVIFRVGEGRIDLEAGLLPARAVSETAVHRFDALAGALVDDFDIDPDRGRVRMRKAPADLD